MNHLIEVFSQRDYEAIHILKGYVTYLMDILIISLV